MHDIAEMEGEVETAAIDALDNCRRAPVQARLGVVPRLDMGVAEECDAQYGRTFGRAVHDARSA
ncbi:MAG: hypothetical protein R3D25_09695 [Geminicoccaceae bacterium]